MSSQPSNEIFLVNPYQSHTSLTPVEAEVLWEYAKLAQNLRMVCPNFLSRVEKKNIHITSSKVTQKTRLLHEEPDKHMLAKLRILEKKMGLVLTLVSTTQFYLNVILLFHNSSRPLCGG
jgi:DASH complex subunit DAD3